MAKRPYTRHQPVRHTPKLPSATPSLVEADDAALGIGDDDTSSGDAAPDLAALIEAAVDARLRQMGMAPRASDAEQAFMSFLDKFEHIAQVRDEQRPGYNKPLTAEETDGRKRGKADMFALLAKFKADGVWPEYLLNDESNPYYGESVNGLMLYEAGQRIKARVPPAEGWLPMDGPAEQVFEAYKRWIGEVVPVEELRARAAAVARGEIDAAPMVAPGVGREPEVQAVEGARVDVKPKRTLGTITPELQGRPMPRQPGVSAQPIGPVFVGDGA